MSNIFSRAFYGLGQTSSVVTIGTQTYTLYPDGQSALKAGFGNFYHDSTGQLTITGPYGPLHVLDPTNVSPTFKGAGYLYNQNNVLYVGGPAGPITVNQKSLVVAPPPPPVDTTTPDLTMVSTPPTTIKPTVRKTPVDGTPCIDANGNSSTIVGGICQPVSSSGTIIIVVVMLGVIGVLAYILIQKKKKKKAKTEATSETSKRRKK